MFIEEENKRISFYLFSHIFIFPLQINLSLDTFYRGPLMMFQKTLAKPLRNNNLRCENEAMQSYWRIHKNFKGKKYCHLANFY